MPVPLIVRAPLPPRIALIVPPVSANVPVDDSVPFCIAAGDREDRRPQVCVVVPRSTVPAESVSDPVFAPSVPLPVISRVPPLTIVPPE